MRAEQNPHWKGLWYAAPAVAVFTTASLHAGDSIRYNRDIRPILSDACFHCHGPDEKNRKGGLRLDSREDALKPAKSGARAIMPGRISESEIILRIQSTDADEVMPPPKSHRKLSAKQIEILKRWVEGGAPYETHWAFVPIQNASIPSPKITRWIKNPIDAFIAEGFERAGLQPSPEASKETLLRRASLDLTGLPPSPGEMDSFLRDESPSAYEKQVDRLLQSPRYGERMAVDWMDAARYADSNGYQVDRDRDVWPWRDWVIDAFNRNMPFDRFTVEQIAGDLLPNPTQSQKVATGFHRNHMVNEEGGVIADEFLAEYTADRVETTAAVWLGQTFNCARCHDHKYDPFTQRDFYSLKAFFHNINERGVGAYSQGYRTSNPPFLKLPSEKQRSEMEELEKQIGESNKRLAELNSANRATLPAWLEKITSRQAEWIPFELISASGVGERAQIQPGENAAGIAAGSASTSALKLTMRVPAGQWTAVRIEFSARGEQAIFQCSSVKASSIAPPPAGAGVAKKASRRTLLSLEAAVQGTSLPAAETAKLTNPGKGTKVSLQPGKETPAGAVFSFEPRLPGGESADFLEIDIAGEHSPAAGQWKIYGTQSDPDLLVPDSLVGAAKKSSEARTKPEAEQLSSFHASLAPGYREENKAIEKLKKQLTDLDQTVPTTLVMEEMKQARPTFILQRGAYDKPGDAVTAAPPAVLPPLPEGEPANRLGLARWLVDSSNPLTARVTVNRFWQAAFGNGLVRTSEDFGSQGELPSHPELLDWLASEFMRSGWDVKALMRMVVTSATYRQSSSLTPVLLQKDPENRLLARGPRFRIQAEFLRDQALAAAGFLSPMIGGPPAKPYHPPGLYEQVTAGSGTNRWIDGKGEDLYRRSMYTYWKRSVPHPAMLLFDAPFRESCTLRRPRSNTPLQALNLMNDPTYVEACRGIAQRAMKEAGPGIEQRLTHGFRLLLARRPTPQELPILKRAYERHLERFTRDTKVAEAYLRVGEFVPDSNLKPAEIAALSAVTSSVLNSDEWITKE